MIRNYFKIAWRNLSRKKGYAAINIFGLAVGIASCLLILQYVAFELGYENFHANKDRIYRVQQDRYDNGKLSTQWVSGAYAVGNSFKEAIPGIEEYVKVVDRSNCVTEIDNHPVKLHQVYFASSGFFDVFTYPLLQGDKSKALTEQNTAAISESTAKNLFGNTKVLGKTLKINGDELYTISAVYKDAPANTQLKPNVLLSYATYRKFYMPDNDPDKAWTWDGCITYLLLRKDANPKTVESKFPAIVNSKTGEELKRFNASVIYTLQPLTDIHLTSHYIGEPGPSGDGKTVYLLLGISIFIVLIAWVNYINLATAHAIGRAKEVGIRKAIGSQRKQLIFQFLSESALLNGLAILLAILIVIVAIPGFNSVSGQELSISLFTKANFWVGVISLFVIGVFFSGMYPAFVLSGFKPIEVLKGKLSGTRQNAGLRKSLVVFQFSASLFLLIGTITVYQQIKYMRSQSLGINIDQTFVVSAPVITDSTWMKKMTAFKEVLANQSSVKGVTASTSIPGEPVGWNAGGIKLVGSDESTQKQYRVIGVDYDFTSYYGMKIIAGRPFSKEYGTENRAVIFNRKGVEQLGFNKPEEAIGKRIDFWGDQYTIAGVTENFHQQSLKESFEPLILRLIPDVRGSFSIRTSGTDANNTIKMVEGEWNKFFPGNTFDYFFLDEHFDAQYKADNQFGTVFGIFTGLAILVACMGLFGLASFTTYQRTKEIGIRKVLGASVKSILVLLFQEFATLLAIAFLIAAPIAWYANSQWLQAYTFRISIHWTYLLIPFVAIIAIAMITVSFQSIKAALANPVKSLRSE